MLDELTAQRIKKIRGTVPDVKIKVTPEKFADFKILPHSIEAEQAVIGGLMLDNASFDRITEILTENDFYRPEHRQIFQVLHSLNRINHPFDVVTVADALKNLKQLENVGGDTYLFTLAKNTPTAANINAYAHIVRERSILRQLIQSSNTIIDMAFNPDGRNSKSVLDLAEGIIFKIGEEHAKGQGPVDISSLLARVTDRVDALFHSNEPITGVASGFNDLDELTSGFQSGDLVIVAGRPSMGKTTFAMNIAEHVIIQSKKAVLVFSMEMPGESLALRMMSSLGHIDQHRMRTGKLQEEDWPRLTSAVSLLSEAPLYIDDAPALSPTDLRARARRLVKSINKELGLIIIDYIQLMQIPGFRENRTAEITEISRALKALSKELNVPVIALSQLNRSLEQRGDRRPVMSDLRESGAIEQDADIILFIYRDEVYHEDSPDKGIAEILIAKHRNGPIGKVRLTFLGQYTRFQNYTPGSNYFAN